MPRLEVGAHGLLPTSPHISPHLPTSPYISLSLLEVGAHGLLLRLAEQREHLGRYREIWGDIGEISSASAPRRAAAAPVVST